MPFQWDFTALRPISTDETVPLIHFDEGSDVFHSSLDKLDCGAEAPARLKENATHTEKHAFLSLFSIYINIYATEHQYGQEK